MTAVWSILYLVNLCQKSTVPITQYHGYLNAPWANPAGTACSQSAGVFCLGYLLAYKLDGTSGTLSQIWPKTLPTNTTVPDFASTPFATPTAAHGHVYVPTFALCSSFTGGNCTGASYMNAGVQAYF